MIHWMQRSVALVAVALMATGCATVKSTFDALNPFGTVKLKPAELQNFKPTIEVRTNWTVDVGDSEGGAFTPVVYDKVVYAASEEGVLMAVDQGTGQIKWRNKLNIKLRAGVAVTVDTVAVIDDQNQLRGFDLTGKQKWIVPVGNEVTSFPVASGSTIVVRTIDYSVIAFAADSGLQRWKLTRSLPALTLRVGTPVDINNGRVYAGMPSGRIVAIDLASGNQLWEGAISSPSGTTEIERITDITGAPQYNFREVCASAFQGRLGCLDAISAKPLWTAEVSSPNGVSVDDRYLIAANESGDLFAFSRSGGKRAWRIETFQRRQPTTPTPVSRAVAVGDFEGYVHFIERDSGRTIARTQVGSTAFTSRPVGIDGTMVVVQSREGALALISTR